MAKTTEVIAMILAGGKGDRLSVLSQERAKSAVPFGGKYRLIDFALSNCVNSDIYTVGVLTQYLPRSLNEHIRSGIPWDLNRRWGGVKLLPPYVQRSNSNWYRGTADALYQNLDYIKNFNPELVLVLSGDHTYKMDYRALIDFHRERESDATLCMTPVSPEETSRVGTIQVDETGRVLSFEEKIANAKSNLASMGIYLFNYSFLIEKLELKNTRDIVYDIILKSIDTAHLHSYRHDQYWRNIGTIEDYYRANMDLIADSPPLIMDEPDCVIHTHSEERPPVKFGPNAEVLESMFSNGCIINGKVIRSVLSPGVIVEEGAIVEDTIIFNDTHIRAGAKVDKAILDKNIMIPSGSVIGDGDDVSPNERHPELSSGITLIGKGTILPENIKIGRNCVLDIRLTTEDFSEPVIPSGTFIENLRKQP